MKKDSILTVLILFFAIVICILLFIVLGNYSKTDNTGFDGTDTTVLSDNESNEPTAVSDNTSSDQSINDIQPDGTNVSLDSSDSQNDSGDETSESIESSSGITVIPTPGLDPFEGEPDTDL